MGIRGIACHAILEITQCYVAILVKSAHELHVELLPHPSAEQSWSTTLNRHLPPLPDGQVRLVHVSSILENDRLFEACLLASFQCGQAILMYRPACAHRLRGVSKFPCRMYTVNQENIEDFVDKEALKSCCGKECALKPCQVPVLLLAVEVIAFQRSTLQLQLLAIKGLEYSLAAQLHQISNRQPSLLAATRPHLPTIGHCSFAGNALLSKSVGAFLPSLTAIPLLSAQNTGLQCPVLFESYQKVVNGVCANATLSGPPVEALKLIMDMIDDNRIKETWEAGVSCKEAYTMSCSNLRSPYSAVKNKALCSLPCF
eukprot:1161401-Pelagomonas_calceolata.AAC.25